MKKSTYFAAVVSAACLVLSSGFAQAATVTANPGDLVLSFRATGGQGAAFNLEIDLGSLSNYLSLAPGTTINLSSRISLADLQATYSTGGTGNSWASRTDLFWSVAGTSGNTGVGGLPTFTLFGTSVGGTVYNRYTAGSQAVPSGLISTEVGSLNGATTAGTAYSAILNAADAGSYSYQITDNGNAQAPYTAGSQLNWGAVGGAPFENNPSLTTATSDLYELLPVARFAAPGTSIGQFNLGSDGSLSFTTAAVPEPSTWAMLGLGAGALLVARRRRAAQA